MTEDTRLARMTPPAERIDVVIDTDTYNEIDDQFAIVHALLSPEKLNVQAIHAAPFFTDFNPRSTSANDGMEKSHEEILRLLELMDVSAEGLVYRGSSAFLPSEDEAVESDAARDLIRRAQASTGPLYVVALAALTNIASALLLDPGIRDKIVVVWLGGHAFHWPHTREFNLLQERAATRVVLRSEVPLVLIPCMGVTSHLHTTVPELERYVESAHPVGRFLTQRFKEYKADHLGWSKEVWDLAPVAYLLDASWVPTKHASTPELTDDLTWRLTEGRHTLRVATFVDRNAIFKDLFTKLAARR